MFEKVPSGCDAIFMKIKTKFSLGVHMSSTVSKCTGYLYDAQIILIILDQIMLMEIPLEASLPLRDRSCSKFLMQIHCVVVGREPKGF